MIANKIPEVHGTKKTLDMNLLPEKQKVILQNKRVIENKLRLGQGRAEIRHKTPTNREYTCINK